MVVHSIIYAGHYIACLTKREWEILPIADSEAFKVTVKLERLSLSRFMIFIFAYCYSESSNLANSDK